MIWVRMRVYTAKDRTMPHVRASVPCKGLMPFDSCEVITGGSRKTLGAEGGCEGNFSKTLHCPISVPQTCLGDRCAWEELGPEVQTRCAGQLSNLVLAHLPEKPACQQTPTRAPGEFP